MGRIILPPRTGKTMIALHTVRMTGLTATIIVPTKPLVDQTVTELAQKNPDIRVGTYCGESKDLVGRYTAVWRMGPDAVWRLVCLQGSNAVGPDAAQAAEQG